MVFFGDINCNTGKCFLSPISDRSINILPIIKSKIKPGTTIYSDCLKSYNCLENESFQQLTVKDSITFKDKETGCHTNAINGLWKHVKNVMPPTNRKPYFNSYLCEYMYRRTRGEENRFSKFVQDIAKDD